MLKMKIIRKTKSVCPICIGNIDADIIEEKNKIYMAKKCKQHGKFKILISEDSSFYNQLNKLCLILYNKKPLKIPKPIYQLYLTFKCNLNCPICYTNANSISYNEPSLQYIRKTIKKWKNIEIFLFGGEPTMREDIAEIIRSVEETGNIPVLVTNGIKIADIEFLKKIKTKRLLVLLQFDGFTEATSKKIRGKSLIKIKEKALSNLKNLSIPSTLEIAVAKNINDKQIGDMLEFVLNKTFIKEICYRAVGYMGKKGLDETYTPTVNNLIDMIEKQTNRRISKKDIINFQKFIYFFKMNFPFLPVYPCLNAPQYLVYRNKNTYKPISEFICLDVIKKDIEEYFFLIESGEKIKAFFITNKILLKIITKSNFFPLFTFFISIVFRNIKRSRATLANVQKNWLLLRFSTLCEPNTFDYTIAKNCNGGEIKTDLGVSHCRGICNILRERNLVLKK